MLQLISGVFGNERSKTRVMVLLGRRERRTGKERGRKGAEEEGRKAGGGGDELWEVEVVFAQVCFSRKANFTSVGMQ
jgi:hypothetical protein